ncbi:MAG TPA: hypothetical protein VN704_08425 [Verrucomicrobiae bacterium]|nr:hypothetical protein [Verrucomicrobiae bacterium]
MRPSNQCLKRHIKKICLLLNTFIDENHDEGLNSFINKNRSVDIILTSHFKINNPDGKQSIDFLHKSFQEYLLDEYYIESILQGKGYRLNVGTPSSMTIDFSSSLMNAIRENEN